MYHEHVLFTLFDKTELFFASSSSSWATLFSATPALSEALPRAELILEADSNDLLASSDKY